MEVSICHASRQPYILYTSQGIGLYTTNMINVLDWHLLVTH